MKKLIIITLAFGILSFLATTGICADTYVNGYTKSNGTFVQPHYRTSPNSTTSDNYSTQGNVNPYTGNTGTHNPYSNTGTNNHYNTPTTGTTYGNPVNTYNPPTSYHSPYGR